MLRPAASNRQSEVRTSAGALVRSFAYRAGGDIAAQTVAPATLYTHDARGRIASVTEGGVLAASYRYDWREHRTASMDASGAQTHYLFDDEGHLLAEYDALSGNLLREYAWAGDMVLAMATGPVATPNWSYITTGHLNEPVMVTSQAGAVVSSTTRDPWGNPILIAGSNVIALGYPGQWKDLAGGLFHNWNRDYDPTLGRHIESDPIGLAGGSNVYGYVGGNPVNRVDPRGLVLPAFAIPMVIGAGIGVALDVGSQLLTNGGNWDCIDPWDVGVSAGLGAVGGGLGSLTRIRRVGTEFSHWIPERYIRPMSLSGKNVNPEYKPILNTPIIRKFIKSTMNGNFVKPRTHAVTDPHRYLKGMTKADNLHPALQQAMRIPGWLGGAVAGSAVGVATSSANGDN